MIQEIKLKPNNNLVKTIERLLSDACDGTLQSLCFAGERSDNSVDWGVVGGINKFSIAGQLLHIANKTLNE